MPIAYQTFLPTDNVFHLKDTLTVNLEQISNIDTAGKPFPNLENPGLSEPHQGLTQNLPYPSMPYIDPEQSPYPLHPTTQVAAVSWPPPIGSKSNSQHSIIALERATTGGSQSISCQDSIPHGQTNRTCPIPGPSRTTIWRQKQREKSHILKHNEQLNDEWYDTSKCVETDWPRIHKSLKPDILRKGILTPHTL
jgi:hypothetical protein